MTKNHSHCAMPSDYDRWLPQYQVRWSWELDPVQHESTGHEHQTQTVIHAVMEHGQAIVDTQTLPGQTILIQNQLHDRGLDPNKGAFFTATSAMFRTCWSGWPMSLVAPTLLRIGTTVPLRMTTSREHWGPPFAPRKSMRVAFPPWEGLPDRHGRPPTPIHEQYGRNIYVDCLFDAQTAATMFNTLFTG